MHVEICMAAEWHSDLVEVMPCRIQVVRMDKQKWTGVGVAEQAKYVVHPARLCSQAVLLLTSSLHD